MRNILRLLFCLVSLAQGGFASAQQTCTAEQVRQMLALGLDEAQVRGACPGLGEASGAGGGAPGEGRAPEAGPGLFLPPKSLSRPRDMTGIWTVSERRTSCETTEPLIGGINSCNRSYLGPVQDLFASIGQTWHIRRDGEELEFRGATAGDPCVAGPPLDFRQSETADSTVELLGEMQSGFSTYQTGYRLVYDPQADRWRGIRVDLNELENFSGQGEPYLARIEHEVVLTRIPNC